MAAHVTIYISTDSGSSYFKIEDEARLRFPDTAEGRQAFRTIRETLRRYEEAAAAFKVEVR